MNYLAIAALLVISLNASVAQESAKPLDPAAVARQLYLMSDRSWGGSGSYSINGDGTVHFYVQINSDLRVYGSGRTPEAALDDLQRKSDFVANNLVPEAERNRAATLSIIDGIKAILFGDRKSQ